MLDSYIYFVSSQTFGADRIADPTNDVIGYFIVARDESAWRIVSAEAWYAPDPPSLTQREKRGTWDGERVAGTQRDILIVYQFRYDPSNHDDKHTDYQGLFAIRRQGTVTSDGEEHIFTGKFYKLTNLAKDKRHDGDIVASRVFSTEDTSDVDSAVDRAKEKILGFCTAVRQRRL